MYKTTSQIDIKDSGLHNLGFVGEIKKARFKPGGRTPWIGFEHCRVVPRDSKPRRKHVNAAVLAMLTGVCFSLSPDTLGAKIGRSLRRYGWETWKELGDDLVYGSDDLYWIEEYLCVLKKSVSAAVGLDHLAPPCRVTPAESTLHLLNSILRGFFAAARMALDDSISKLKRLIDALRPK